MSKDIRSYFGNISETPSKPPKGTEGKNLKSKKRNRRILDSDNDSSEDEKSVLALHKKRYRGGPKSAVANYKSKAEVIARVENFFGNTPVIQKRPRHLSPENDKTTKQARVQEKKKRSELCENNKGDNSEKDEDPLFQCDEELEASILQTDNVGVFKTSVLSSEEKDKSDTSGSNASGKKSVINSKKVGPSSIIAKEKSFDTSKKQLKQNAKETYSTPKKKDESFLESSYHFNSEQKKKSNEAYQRYLHRSGPKNPGSKEIPEGTPTCLEGLTFVVTGILDSLEREEAINLIQRCGGRVTSQVSKKTSYVIVGEEPGESKIQKAEKFETQKINEDELLKLIIEKSKSDSTKTGFVQKTQKEIENSSKGKKLKFAEFLNEKNKEIGPSLPKAKKMENEKEFVTAQCDYQSAKVLSLAEQSVTELNDTKCPSDHKLNVKIPPVGIQNSEIMLWVEKYKPKSTKGIVGQGGDKSNVKKLIHWLQNWHKNHSSKSKKASKPAPWTQNDDGSYFKAALLSGPPGVGKTTTIHLVCQELGLDIIEFNASDTRSKRLLQEDVSELLSSKSLRNFFEENGNSRSNHVLVMDEVDGMAGNEDRGGIQELIQLVKQTKIPIIGICNDRNHPKMRSFVNYCFDLRFQKPPMKQIKAAMMSICFKENLNISGEVLEELIVTSNHDLRQILHRLSLLTFVNKTLSLEEAKKNGEDIKKPINMSPWDIVRKVFSVTENQKNSLNEKMDLFFQDYSLGPLFVQDSYLHVKPFMAKNSVSENLALISKAADCIALGDIVEKTIRNQNSWNLLPVQAVLSSVLPGHYMTGHFMGKIEFPMWLGKNSKTRKFGRLLQDLHITLSTSISGDSHAVNLDYLQSLKNSIVNPLIVKGNNGVDESVKFMVDYNLVREDLDHILELSTWPGIKDSFSNVDSKVKAAFTRTLNKEFQRVSCAANIKTKGATDYSENQSGEEDIFSEEIDSIESDPMIKKGKPKKSTKLDTTKKGPAPKKDTNKKSKEKKKK